MSLSPVKVTCLLLIQCLGLACGFQDAALLKALSTLGQAKEFRDIRTLVIQVDQADIDVDSMISKFYTAFVDELKCEARMDFQVLLVDLSSKQGSQSNHSFSHCKWLVPESASNTFSPAFDSNIYTWSFDQGDELTVKEVYGVTPDSPMIKNHVITIKNKTLKYENTKEKYERRQDLGGINITATLISSPPFLIVPPGQPEKSFGHQVDVMRDLEQLFNFTIKFITPKRGTFGVLDQNGTWDGMMEQVVTRQADLSLMLQVSEQRAQYVEFYHVLGITGLSLVSRKGDQKIRFSFISMLQLPVWMISTVVVLIFFIHALVMSFLWQKLAKHSCSTIITSVFGSLVNQASEELLKKVSMRILLFTVLVFGFVGINLLAANLTSSISVRKETIEIESLEDVEKKGYELYIYGGTSIEQDFAIASEGSIKNRLWKSQLLANPSRRPRNIKHLFANFLKSEKGAMVMYKDLIVGWTMYNKHVGCQLKQKELDHGTLKVTMASWKGFPYHGLFNWYFYKFLERGLLNRLDQKWKDNVGLSHDYICSSISKPPEVSIGLEGTRFFFFIIAFGAGLSLILAINERFGKWLKAKAKTLKRPQYQGNGVPRRNTLFGSNGFGATEYVNAISGLPIYLQRFRSRRSSSLVSMTATGALQKMPTENRFVTKTTLDQRSSSLDRLDKSVPPLFATTLEEEPFHFNNVNDTTTRVTLPKLKSPKKKAEQ